MLQTCPKQTEMFGHSVKFLKKVGRADQLFVLSLPSIKNELFIKNFVYVLVTGQSRYGISADN